MDPILALLGVQNEAEATKAIETFNAWLSGIKEATGCQTLTEAKARVGALAATVASLATITGKQDADEAIGVVRAWQEGAARIPEFEAQIAKEAEKAEFNAAIANANGAKKLTPAIEERVRASYDAGDITLKGAVSMLEALPVISALEPKIPQSSANRATAPTQLKHDGKSFAEMSGMERHALKNANPELYDTMRSEAEAAGLI